MLRSLHMLVLALATTLGIASSASAIASETALRANRDFPAHRVTDFGEQAREPHQQTALGYGETASDSSLAARGGAQAAEVGAQAAEKVASTPMGRAIQSLRETLSTGKGPWKLNTAHAEGSVSKVYGPNATSIEEVFVHQGTGERLIRHTVVEGDEVLHETFRQFSKFE